MIFHFKGVFSFKQLNYKFNSSINLKSKRTGLIYESKLIESINDQKIVDNLNKAYDIIQKDCLKNCEKLYILGDSENKQDDSQNIKEEKQSDTDAKLVEDISLKCATELMDRIINGNMENGISFITNKSKNVDINLTKLSIEKYNLKRVLWLNWDLKPNNLAQKEFSNNSKFLKLSLIFENFSK